MFCISVFRHLNIINRIVIFKFSINILIVCAIKNIYGFDCGYIFTR